jgi:hypothetical protein
MPALYFGTGVLSPKYGMSCGLPFEYLEFFCDAFALAMKYGCNRVVQELTDVYELFTTPTNAVAQECLRQEWYITQLTNFLGVVDRFQLIRASAFRGDPEYLECLAEIRRNAQSKEITVASDYVLLQSAGVDYFRRVYGVSVKMGWVIDPENPSGGKFDEYYFNRCYQDITGDQDFPFTYVNAAIDPSGSRCSPYLLRPGDIVLGRACIHVDFDTKSLLPFANGNKGQKKYWAALERSIGKLEELCRTGVFNCALPWAENAPLLEKVDGIINALFNVGIAPAMQFDPRAASILGAAP